MKKIFSLLLIITLMTTFASTASAINDIDLRDYHGGSSFQVQSGEGINESISDVHEIDFYNFKLQTASTVYVILQPLDYVKDCYLTALIYNDDNSLFCEPTRAFNELGQRWVSTFITNLPAGNYTVAVLCDAPNVKYTNANYYFYYLESPLDSVSSFKDFSDIDTKYQGDVEYVAEKGIITGYGDNTFRPKALLTRGAAAKFIASLKLGTEKANSLSITTAPFKDVSANHAFAPYIAYCSSMKYINGYSDGTFRPNNPLTAAAFAKMLLNAIGFNQDSSRYTVPAWKENVYSDAIQSGIFKTNMDFGLDDTLSREKAAFLLHNAMLWVNVHGSDASQPATSPSEQAKPTTPSVPQYPSAITLSASSLTIKQNSGGSVSVSITPSNAVNKNITWSSSNRSVATVDSAGYVWGVSAGTATITATTANGLTASYTVTVTNSTTTPPAGNSSSGINTTILAQTAYDKLKNAVYYPDTLQIYNIWSYDLNQFKKIEIYYSAENGLGQQTRGYYIVTFNPDGSVFNSKSMTYSPHTRSDFLGTNLKELGTGVIKK